MTQPETRLSEIFRAWRLIDLLAAYARNHPIRRKPTMSMLTALLAPVIASFTDNEIVHLAETKLLALVGKESGPVIQRLITIPQADIAKICASTGADQATAEQLQTDATAAYAKFVGYLGSGQTGA